MKRYKINAVTRYSKQSKTTVSILDASHRPRKKICSEKTFPASKVIVWNIYRNKTSCRIQWCGLSRITEKVASHNRSHNNQTPETWTMQATKSNETNQVYMTVRTSRSHPNPFIQSLPFMSHLILPTQFQTPVVHTFTLTCHIHNFLLNRGIHFITLLSFPCTWEIHDRLS